MSLLIRGGRVIDPARGLDTVADVLIADGKIAQVAPSLPTPPGEVIDAQGCVVVPGLIDLHAHAGMPGFEDREDLVSGGLAAVRGGFTGIAVMPERGSPLDSAAAVRGLLARAREEAPCRVYAAGALTAGGEGKRLTEAAGLARAGAAALCDPDPVADGGVLRRALRYASLSGLPVFLRCGDPSLEGAGMVNEGEVSGLLGLPGVPAVAETVAVARALLLAEDTGCPVHIGPVTTAGAVELLRQAKARGVPVTAETTFHHLVLTEEAVLGFAPHTKVWPPLRTDGDRRALIQGVADGTIDCLVTDHTPYTVPETEVEWASAPFGIVGLETAVPLSVTHLLIPGELDWLQWVERVSTAPARILRREGGTLAPGAPGDVTVIDPDGPWTVDPARFASRARNTPFAGVTLRGRVVATVVGGRVVEGPGKEPPEAGSGNG